MRRFVVAVPAETSLIAVAFPEALRGRDQEKAEAPKTPKSEQVRRQNPFAATSPPETPPTLPTAEAATSVVVAEVSSQPAAASAQGASDSDSAATGPGSPSQPKVIFSEVEYLRKPDPEYPPKSRRTKDEGTVILRVLVSDTGLPTKAEVQKSSGSERLDEAARFAVMNALFKPHIENGRALTVFVLVPISFKLND